jgi:SWI/SNF-related matrix-associated actin-dependent regulator of chromatin subfamily A member 5
VLKQKEYLKKKVESYKAPLQQLHISQTVGHGKKVYTEDEDRFLIVQLHKYGLDSPTLYEQIRDAIRVSPMFRFDWFFLSRTPAELSRRCATLITSIQREYEPEYRSRKRAAAEFEDETSSDFTEPVPKSRKMRNKRLAKVSSRATSRATSVESN